MCAYRILIQKCWVTNKYTLRTYANMPNLIQVIKLNQTIYNNQYCYPVNDQRYIKSQLYCFFFVIFVEFDDVS